MYMTRFEAPYPFFSGVRNYFIATERMTFGSWFRCQIIANKIIFQNNIGFIHIKSIFLREISGQSEKNAKKTLFFRDTKFNKKTS